MIYKSSVEFEFTLRNKLQNYVFNITIVWKEKRGKIHYNWAFS